MDSKTYRTCKVYNILEAVIIICWSSYSHYYYEKVRASFVCLCCLSWQVAEQQIGMSSDIQDGGSSEKSLKGQICMDTTLEDKICDLYDIFVDVRSFILYHLALK